MVRLKRFFNPTHYGRLKKNSTQINPSHKSNPTHMSQVESMDWTIFIIIIIKLSRKKYKYKYIKKNSKININVIH